MAAAIPRVAPTAPPDTQYLEELPIPNKATNVRRQIDQHIQQACLRIGSSLSIPYTPVSSGMAPETIMKTDDHFKLHWKKLLKKPNYLEYKDGQGYTPLHKAFTLLATGDCRKMLQNAGPFLLQHPEMIPALKVAAETSKPHNRRAKLNLIETYTAQLLQDTYVPEQKSTDEHVDTPIDLYPFITPPLSPYSPPLDLLLSEL